MKTSRLFAIAAAALAAALLISARLSAAGEEEEPPGDYGAGGLADLPAGLEEARSRARWMSELINGSLQIMHRDFFDEDNPAVLPSQSLEDVFREMARSWSVDIRWLGVNATKGRKHRPADDFEREASRALLRGAPEFERVEGDRYRFVKSIRIQNECLKCHVPYRTSMEDRVGGIAFSFPFLDESAAGPAPGSAKGAPGGSEESD